MSLETHLLTREANTPGVEAEDVEPWPDGLA